MTEAASTGTFQFSQSSATLVKIKETSDHAPNCTGGGYNEVAFYPTNQP